MLDMIQTAIYTPTVSVFDAYPNLSPELAAEIEDWKRRFKEHCEKQTDFAAFMGQFYGSDIQVESSNLLSRAAMEAMGGAPQQNDVNSEAEVISVKDYLEQYRSAYDEVRAAGYRKRGEAAYEELFNVANRTDDMVEAQIIIEKERLLWKIVSEDTLDIYETIQEAMDPLYEGVTFPISAYAEVYKKVTCDEDLTYELERLKTIIPIVVQRSVVKIFLAAVIGTNILNFAKGKNKLHAWASDTSAQEGLSAMIACRANIRTFIKILRDHFDMSFEDMVGDEFTKLWLLNPRNMDSLGRIKRVLDPQNLAAYKEIVNECLSDRTIEEILLTESRYMVYFDLERENDDYERKSAERAKELDSGLTYYRYEATLKKTVESMCNIK